MQCLGKSELPIESLRQLEPRVDLILAIASLRGEKALSRLAYRLGDDPTLRARRLALDLEALPEKTRELLSRRALEAEQVVSLRLEEV